MADLGTLWFGSDIDLTTLKQKIQQGNKSILDALKMDYDPQSYQEMIGRLRTSLARETFEIKINANPQGLAQNLRQSLGSNKGLTGGLDELNEKILAQTEAVNRLKAKLESLRATYANQKRAGQYLQLGNTGSSIADVRRELALEKQTLADFIAQRNTLRNATKDTMLNLRREAMEHKNTATAAGQSLRQRREAIRQLNTDHLRLNTTLAGGVHVSTQLGSALSALFAVHTARAFLSHVIEIGGQLEKQRISIGAILGDTVKASHLFEQIKGLALQSPFGVVELDQYTKQLSAYGFKYSELFDMTKRLADISAGAGTDIGRLTLALGHVRSATYLTGITLRQFSMNNIPMLKMLADYYSEVEKHAVTTAEVQKRISKRQVSYEDVIEQIRRLTNEGGMFYNMQEKISESLAARYKNLKDAMDIMYGEMAEGEVGDMLKELATVLLKTTRHWKEIASVVGVAATAFALSKLRIGASTIAMQSNTAATVKNIIADKQLTAAKIRQMGITRSLTTEEKAALITSNQLRVADLRQALASGALTKEEALRLITLKRIKIAQAMHLAGVNGITAAEIRAAVAANRWSVALKGVGVSLRNAFMGVGAGTWATLGAMVGMEIYSAYSSWVERIDEKTKEMKDLIKSRIIDLQKQQKIIVGGEKPKDSVELQNRVDDMKQVLANSEAYTKTLDEQLGKAGGINEQYDILVGAIDKAVEKNRQLLTYQDEIGEAIKMSSGDFMSTSFNENLRWFFNDDINQNMSQTLDAYKDLRKVVEGAWEYKDAIKGVIDEMITAGEVSEGFAVQLKNAPFEEQIRLLAESGYWDTIVGRVVATNADFADFADNLKDASNGVTERWDEIASDDIPRMMKQIAKERNISEEELKKWALNNIDDFKMMLDGISDQLDIKEPSVRKRLKKLFYDYVRFSELEKGLAEGAEIGASVFGDIYQTLLDEDESADIKDNKKGDKGKAGGSSRNTDQAAKEMRQQIKLIKDAYSWYKKYKDELKWSPRDAFAEIGAKYGDVLKKLGVDWDAEKGDITSYSKSLQNLLEKAEALYATPAHKNSYMLDVIKELKDALQQTDFDEMKESMQHFASEMELTLKNLSRQWELYKSIRDATGSRELAAQLSGTGGLFNNMAESLESIITDLSEGMAIDFGSVVNMDDKAIKDYVASLGLSKEKTDGIINALEQWRDLQRNLLNESITSYAKMLTDADSLKKKLVEINSNYKDQIVQLKTLRKNGYIDEDEYNKRASQADRTRKLNLAEAFVGGFDWSQVSQIYGNILTGAAEQLKRKLDELISSEDFKQMSITEQRKYLNLQSKLRKNDDSVMSPFNISEWRNATEHLKNFQGATQRLIEATSDYEQAIRDEKEATKALTEAKTDEERATAQAALNAAKKRKNAASGNMSQAQSDMQQEGQEFLDAESKAAQGLSNFASAIQTISSGKLSDFVMGIDAIINTIAGKEKSASLGEAVTGILEGVGVKSGNIYGMIIAAIIELIDAIGDDAGGFVGGIVDKIFDLITGLIDDIFSGDLVEKIAKSIFEGIGSLISSIVKNIGTLPVGIFNIVKGAVGGIFGGLFEGLGLWNSDEDLQEEIEASQRQVEVLERIHDLLEKKLEYVLGGVYNFSNPENTRQFSAKTNGYKEYFENQLKWAKKAQDGSRTVFNWYAAMPADMLKESVDYLTKAVEAFNRANKTGEYYDQQRALLFAQRRELETQLANEQDKKGSDSAAIENYMNQIEDLDFQIKNFAMDMAKALYDIDLQSWASELTDAVVSAWENGEDAAEAYTNKVKDLMKDLTKNILAKKVMEQAFKNAGLDDLIVRLMDESSGKLDYSAIPEIAKALGKAGANSTDVITRVLDEMERQGYIDKGDGKSDSGSVTSGIKSITENTADLLASYINAIRADVSVNRVSISVNLPLIASAVQRSSVLAETQVALQTQIAQNTQRSAEAAEAIQNILRLATVDRSHAIFMQ